MQKTPPLILGSTSPYRRELLARLGIPFSVAAPGIDESSEPGERPADTALRLAAAKARTVAHRHADALVIGSDQVADCAGRAIGKPQDRARAIAELGRLSGQTVVFHTGLALIHAPSGRIQTALVPVTSRFRTLRDDEIGAYLDRDAPYDCAGGVKSEGLGIALFESITSDDPTALIGLPLIALCRMLRAEGLDPLLAPGAS